MTDGEAGVPESWQREARRVAGAVRRRALALALRDGGGYLSQACSSAEILATLYTRVMRLGPSVAPRLPLPFAGVPGPGKPAASTGAAYNGPRAPELDRFVFSPVHYAVALYCTLVETGRLAPEALEQVGRDGSTLETIGAEHSPGHEVTAGSLGQALSQAGGIALARRLRGETGRVWVFMSDGELQEGQSWEAFSALAHHRLDNVGVYLDVNARCCDGPVESVTSVEPVRGRLETFGARVHEVDGHDVQALAAPALEVPDGRPLAVLARTDPTRGLAPLRDREPRLHHVRFSGAHERARFEDALRRMDEEAAR